MGYATLIEWAHHTHNRWIGCARAWGDLPLAEAMDLNPPPDARTAPECDNCYAEAADRRHLYEPVSHWGAGAPRYVTSDAYHQQPFKWDREARAAGERRRVFGGSQMDFADAEAPRGEREQLFEVINCTPNLDWLMLTKRPERLQRVLPWFECWEEAGGRYVQVDRPWSNVWLGTSVGHSSSLWRVEKLIEAPAALRFLSVEPLLEHLDLAPLLRTGAIGWVIVGGESGRNARDCYIEWVRDIVNQCRARSVPVFVKQLGTKARAAGRLVQLGKKGGDYEDWPEDLRVRELPVAPASRAAA